MQSLSLIEGPWQNLDRDYCVFILHAINYLRITKPDRGGVNTLGSRLLEVGYGSRGIAPFRTRGFSQESSPL